MINRLWKVRLKFLARVAERTQEKKMRHATWDMIFFGSRVTLRRERIIGDFQSECALVPGYGYLQSKRPYFALSSHKISLS